MNQNSGKIAVYAIAIGALVFALATAFDPFKFSSHEPFQVIAGTATTSVTVLNTPPEWSVDAEEQFESSTTTPTNVDSAVSWVGTASDSNAESYYLLICKTSSTPTARSGLTPLCGGGAGNFWAVSSLTAASAQATASYTATSTNPEENVWVAWICDQNASNPECNTSFRQGSGSTASPWYANHRPSFTVFTDTSPHDPGQLITFNSTSSDADVVGGNDQVALFVCRSNDFTGTACGGGGTYCSSTLTSSAASCTSTLATPLQDRNYTAFGYVIDNHGHSASGGAHGTDSIVTVNNVAPTISSSTISLLDTDESGSLTLTAGQAQTTGFKVRFTVADNNSCLNASSGNEIASTSVNVYRSGVTQANCAVAGDYDPNDCYPYVVPTSTWNYSCSQDGGTCAGSADPTAIWTCTFPLWYLADPTDGSNGTDTVYFGENWLATVRARDDNSLFSSSTEASTGNELLSFLAYTLNTTQIAYGSLEPGDRNDPLVATTTVTAQGNVGLDETLYGTDMCTTYPSCNSGSTTSTIAIGNQKYATSSVGYTSTTATAALANPGAELEINILKPTVTSTPTNGTTFWGIQIPITITLAGDYTGVNTIIGVKGEAQNW